MSEPGQQAIARTGFFPIVIGTSVEMERAGAAAVLAGSDVAIANSGAQVVLANGSVSITNGGAQNVLANGAVEISQGGAVVTGAKHVEVHNGWVGLAISPHVGLTDSKIVVGPGGAFLLGLGFAVGFRLVGRARRHR